VIARHRPSRAALFALLTALAPAAVASAQAGPFLEQGGLVVAEYESASIVGGWVAETQHGGYTGASYYRWNGGNQFNSPGKGVLRFDVDIQQASTYYLALHNRHQHPDSSEENDVWVRLDGGKWTKCYSNKGASTVKQWNWHTVFEVGGSHLEPKWTLGKGVHSIEFSGRSQNFMIDRFHLHVKNHPQANDKLAPESPIAGGGANVKPYCQSKTASNACVPAMESSGTPRIGGSAPFLVVAAEVPNNRTGLLFYGFSKTAMPFQGGTLCVGAPATRTRSQDSGGKPTGSDCSGRIGINFGAMAHAGIDPRIAVGATTYAQAWFRDGGASFGAGLSNGLQFTWLP
jgi:hypothetical protein